MRGLAAAHSFAALIGAQQTPTIRVPVRLVSLPTLVFSKEDRLVTDLRSTDFRVFDNDRPQAVTLETSSAPISVVLAVQVSQDVRAYVPFIAKAGSVVDALLVGESGEAAVITYNGDVKIAKPFGGGDVQSTLKKISAGGREARSIDAGICAIAELAKRPSSRGRVLLFIGQPMDSGSEAKLTHLKEQAERENVTVYALALPEFGKAFVSDTFKLSGMSQAEKGGFKGRCGPRQSDCRPQSKRQCGQRRRPILGPDRGHGWNSVSFPQAARTGRRPGHNWRRAAKRLPAELLPYFGASRISCRQDRCECSGRQSLLASWLLARDRLIERP